ncbi:hypothetical protein AOQ84DRAFT_364032 [Glonium stellatum]|uniref:Uncharacterized protein n=1 Tax=Glonium stellatum TaxID=574774 RepID=A0A8E2F0W9_9PEZI|nr:hypothetical protein AOQ84DRAFT_364032 [Glonium stellatum]
MEDPGLADTEPPVPSQLIPNTLIVRFLASVGAAAQKTYLDNLKTQCSKYPSEGTTKYPGVTRMFTRAMEGYTGKFHPTVEKWIKAQPDIVVEGDITMQMAVNVTDVTTNWGLGVVSGFTDKAYKYSHSTLGG